MRLVELGRGYLPHSLSESLGTDSGQYNEMMRNAAEIFRRWEMSRFQEAQKAPRFTTC